MGIDGVEERAELYMSLAKMGFGIASHAMGMAHAPWTKGLNASWAS